MSGFYLDVATEHLRLGDVVTGFPVTVPAAHDKETKLRGASWTIKATHPPYLVVMTPCCSIEDKCLLLAPLGQIRPSFIKNPWFREDLLRINRKVPWDKGIPPEHLAKMGEEEKLARAAEGDQYAIRECFIYAPSPYFDPYMLDVKPAVEPMTHFMVDFKSIFRVECNFVQRSVKTPAGTKVLELTVPSRTSLRYKLADFFSRPAREDLETPTLV